MHVPPHACRHIAFDEGDLFDDALDGKKTFPKESKVG
jgi:hypothetical protein